MECSECSHQDQARDEIFSTVHKCWKNVDRLKSSEAERQVFYAHVCFYILRISCCLRSVFSVLSHRFFMIRLSK